MAGYTPRRLPARKQSSIQAVTVPVSINYVDRRQRTNHFTTPPTSELDRADRQPGTIDNCVHKAVSTFLWDTL